MLRAVEGDAAGTGRINIRSLSSRSVKQSGRCDFLEDQADQVLYNDYMLESRIIQKTIWEEHRKKTAVQKVKERC